MTDVEIDGYSYVRRSELIATEAALDWVLTTQVNTFDFQFFRSIPKQHAIAIGDAIERLRLTAVGSKL